MASGIVVGCIWQAQGAIDDPSPSSCHEYIKTANHDRKMIRLWMLKEKMSLFHAMSLFTLNRSRTEFAILSPGLFWGVTDLPHMSA
jgi:hypothetical protein